MITNLSKCQCGHGKNDHFGKGINDANHTYTGCPFCECKRFKPCEVVENGNHIVDANEMVATSATPSATTATPPPDSRLLTDAREKIAEAEHEQWMRWAKNLLPELRLLTLPHGGTDICQCKTCQRIVRWQSLFKPYAELNEEQKDQDRKEADIVYPLAFAAGEKAQSERDQKLFDELKGRLIPEAVEAQKEKDQMEIGKRDQDWQQLLETEHKAALNSITKLQADHRERLEKVFKEIENHMGEGAICSLSKPLKKSNCEWYKSLKSKYLSG